MLDIRTSLISTLANVTNLSNITHPKDGKSDSNILTNSEKYVFKDSMVLVGDVVYTTKRASVRYNYDEYVCSLWLVYKSAAAEASLNSNLQNIIAQLTANELGLPNAVIDSYFTDVVERGDLSVRIKYHKIEYVVKAYTDIQATKADTIFETISFITDENITTNIKLGV